MVSSSPGRTAARARPCLRWYGEINQDYEAKLEEIKTANVHDALEMSGSRAVWPDVLAVYAVKTTTDSENPQEVATMEDNKKELLKDNSGDSCQENRYSIGYYESLRVWDTSLLKGQPP